MVLYITQLLLKICLSEVSFDMIQLLIFYVIINRLLLNPNNASLVLIRYLR